MYFSHVIQLKSLGSINNIDNSFKHLIYFTIHFKLVNQNDLEPIQQFVDSVVNKKTKSCNHSESL